VKHVLSFSISLEKLVCFDP